MSEATDLALDALAVARITRLITTDRVPFGALRQRVIRSSWDTQRAGVILVGEPGEDQPPLLVEWLSCAWCCSVWVGLAVLILRRLPGWRLVRAVLVSSYVTGFLADR